MWTLSCEYCKTQISTGMTRGDIWKRAKASGWIYNKGCQVCPNCLTRHKYESWTGTRKIHLEEVKRLLAEGKNKSQIARELGVTLQALQSFVKRWIK